MDYSAELRKFYNDNKIQVGGHFGCDHKDSCIKANHGIGLYHGAEAHVGSNYGKVPRIVVVSLDTGHESYNLVDRRTAIEELPEVNDRDQMNPHMRGTSLLLENLLDFQKMPKKGLHTQYAMVNSAKCSSKADNMDKVPSKLYVNCFPFLMEELSILQPQLLVLQGSTVKSLFGKRLKNIEPSVLNRTCKKITQDEQLFPWILDLAKEYFGEMALNDNKSSYVLKTPHPAARDGSWKLFEKTSLHPVAVIGLELIYPS